MHNELYVGYYKTNTIDTYIADNFSLSSLIITNYTDRPAQKVI